MTLFPHEIKEQRPPMVWIIGNSRSGKTAIAEDGVGSLGFRLIESSEWYRANFPTPVAHYKALPGDKEDQTRAYITDISAFTTRCLADDPHFNLSHMTRRIFEPETPCVLEGMRNPYEFMNLFMPQRDLVIFLDRTEVEKYDTSPEQGIALIEQTVRWMRSMEEINEGDAFRFVYKDHGYEGYVMGASKDEDMLVVENLRPFEHDYALIDELKCVVASLAREHMNIRKPGPAFAKLVFAAP